MSPSSARIFSVLALGCTWVLASSDASHLPWWSKMLIGAAGTICGGLVSFSPSVLPPKN